MVAALRTRKLGVRFYTPTNVRPAPTAPHHDPRPVLIAGSLPSSLLTRRPNQIRRDIAESSCKYAVTIEGMHAAEPAGISIEQPAQVPAT